MLARLRWQHDVPIPFLQKISEPGRSWPNSSQLLPSGYLLVQFLGSDRYWCEVHFLRAPNKGAGVMNRLLVPSEAWWWHPHAFPRDGNIESKRERSLALYHFPLSFLPPSFALTSLSPLLLYCCLRLSGTPLWLSSLYRRAPQFLEAVASTRMSGSNGSHLFPTLSSPTPALFQFEPTIEQWT